MQYNVNLCKCSVVSKAQALRFAHLIVILNEVKNLFNIVEQNVASNFLRSFALLRMTNFYYSERSVKI